MEGVQRTLVRRHHNTTAIHDESVADAITACLPSLTHLHVKCTHDAEGMDKLLLRLGSRLTFLRCPTLALHQPSLIANTCTALVSLYPTVTAQRINSLFASLGRCATLSELTVDACTGSRLPTRLCTSHLYFGCSTCTFAPTASSKTSMYSAPQSLPPSLISYCHCSAAKRCSCQTHSLPDSFRTSPTC